MFRTTLIAATLAVAAVRASSTQVSVDVGARLFEVAGTRAALAAEGLDRHWRNARTLASHNPASQKARVLGEYEIHGTPLPNGGFF